MFISSDTNIWFDFEALGHLEHPFLLNHSYFISDLTFVEEINISKEIKEIVTTGFLQVTSVNNEELALVNKLSIKYQDLSFYDLVALAIAIKRKWVLLTGDGLLRNAAINENIECHGSIWIYDELLREKKITKECYLQCLDKLLDGIQRIQPSFIKYIFTLIRRNGYVTHFFVNFVLLKLKKANFGYYMPCFFVIPFSIAIWSVITDREAFESLLSTSFNNLF